MQGSSPGPAHPWSHPDAHHSALLLWRCVEALKQRGTWVPAPILSGSDRDLAGLLRIAAAIQCLRDSEVRSCPFASRSRLVTAIGNEASAEVGARFRRSRRATTLGSALLALAACGLAANVWMRGASAQDVDGSGTAAPVGAIAPPARPLARRPARGARLSSGSLCRGAATWRVTNERRISSGGPAVRALRGPAGTNAAIRHLARSEGPALDGCLSAGSHSLARTRMIR